MANLIPHSGNPAPECTSINEPALEHSTSGSSSEEQDSASFLRQSDIMYSKNLYKLVFDNIDKTINPREIRSNTQAKSLHYVHIYASKYRIDFHHILRFLSHSTLITTCIQFCQLQKTT